MILRFRWSILLLFFWVSVAHPLNFCTSSSSPKIGYRIIGGRSASFAKWPWQALFYNFGSLGWGTMCGATVLNEEWLMTAGHCVINASTKSYVKVGVTDIRKASQSLDVRRIFVHPQFDLRKVFNDIALVQVYGKIRFNSLAQPACLARDDSQLLEDVSYGVVTGFGVYFGESGREGRSLQQSDVLRETEVALIETDECAKIWQRMSGGLTRITDSQLCAGSFMHGTAPGDSGGPLHIQDSFQGDSGGPLHIQDSFGRFIQVGITSFGADGIEGITDQSTYPGVYTRVSAYIPWIESVIGVQNDYVRSDDTSGLVIPNGSCLLLCLNIVILIIFVSCFAIIVSFLSC